MLCRAKLVPNSCLWKKLFCRTYLSNEFKCTNEWSSRLNAPFMQKFKLESFYYDIEQSFNSQKKASAIDVDLFANKITPEDDDHHLEEIRVLLKKFRLTEEATNALDSTSHAVIRSFTDAGKITDLIDILDNRLEYGVFLDDYSASYLLDHLIKTGDFTAAAKVSAQLMLQEDFNNELSRALALYSFYKYLDNPEPFYTENKTNNQESQDKEEVKKVRVKYLRNEFFDNHFDLRDHFIITGKSLNAISKYLDKNLTYSIRLLGNVYCRKFDACMELLNSDEALFHKDVIEKALKHLEKLVSEEKELQDNEAFANVHTSLKNLISNNKLQQQSLSDDIEVLVKQAVAKFEKIELEKQKEIYEMWNKHREIKLNEEIERLNRVKRLQEIEDLTKEMETEEQKLWFFENEDKIDLQIDSKKVYYPKRWFGKKKKPRVVDEGYVPPEIVKTRN
ncbi:28S ribosomal protein S27, mitochondrial [Condylostylus longicornis]|uniref:28S ribosomal protein S27, mitochondrial n=1 Tax=Condylostylus longicornis TaxID=2530218 RepID=UPI00244E4DD6|nr:28S ribosomal protein S27, mitochondrial [Condylostylus longicornis]